MKKRSYPVLDRLLGWLQVAAVSLLAGAGWVASAQTLIGVPQRDYVMPPDGVAMRLPTAVAVGPGGDVYILDGVHDRIVSFDAAGEYQGELRPRDGRPLNQPVGLRVTASGLLWVADGRNSRLVAMRPDGTVVEEWPLPPGEAGRPADPTDLAWTPGEELLWVVDNENHRLLRRRKNVDAWETFGRTGEALGQFQWPFQMVLTATGDALISDVINARVQHWSGEGQPIRNLGSYGVEPGQFYRPGGLALDPDGDLWVADSVTGVVQAFRPDGALIDVLRNERGDPLRLAAPLGLQFDAHGALYIVESTAARVRKFAIERRPRTGPLIEPPRRAAAQLGQQAKACTICHIEWLPPFSEGRDSALMPRPLPRPNEPIVARSELCPFMS